MINTISSLSRLLQPGLILVENAIALETQVEIANACLKRTFHPTTTSRKRLFAPVSTFPEILLQTHSKVASIASRLDMEVEETTATHIIALRYDTVEGDYCHIPWHRDNGDNDGLETAPVVSFSIGDSCDFLVCNEKPRIDPLHPVSNPVNLAHRVRLNSGDALIFGGESRLIWHSIYQIFEKTAPSELPFQGSRLNLTLRHTPHLFDKENEYAVIPSDVKKSNRFFRL